MIVCVIFHFEYFQFRLIDQHHHHYMYTNNGLYLLKHFAVALTNAEGEAGAAELIDML